MEEEFKEENIEKKDVKQIASKIAKKKKVSKWSWPIKILVIALFLSLAISVLSEFVLGRVGIAVC